jgi:protein TonB
MGYQALLFCPDEKAARTVTQVLTELEFSVEACTEPFAAVKKLMGQHFDAVVVDCDNEQNATLLFKSARNSSSNQTSLAVAVVEGQAGVAKAFRIGANLVLTKPINLEQAKGTIRVARGLLRKSEPAKSAGPVSAPAVAPVKSAAPKLTVAPRPAPPAQVPAPKAAEIPAPKAAPPATAWPVAPAATSTPVAKDVEPSKINLEIPVAPPVVAPVAAPTPKLPEAAAVTKPSLVSPSPITSSGAASAPAPALEPVAPVKPLEAAPAEEPAAKTSEEVDEPTGGVVGASPSFSFGGADAGAESGSGKKKILLGVAAFAILGAAYVGWTQFQGNSSQPAATPIATPTPVSKPQAPKPAAAQTSSVPATPAPVESPTATPANSADTDSSFKDKTTHAPAKPSAPTSANSPKSNEDDSPEPAPLVVKSGKTPAQIKAAAADAPAPSLIGMAASSAIAPPQNLVSTTGNAFKPVLQTVNISQGVSQGLLVKKVAPSYPPNALRLHIEGPVELMATISPQGNISHIKVLSGDAQLTKAATDAVKQWKYKPYLLNGEPVEIQTQITINFKLPR